MWLIRSLKKAQAGDTIVEVLIALGVLSMVLVAGYSISTRSINGIRASQERGEALKIAESQIERIRASTAGAASLDVLDDRGVILPNDAFGAPDVVFVAPPSEKAYNGFCFTGTSISKYTISGGPAAFRNPSNYAANPAASQCIFGSRYNVAIQPHYSSLTLGGQEQIAISYTVNVYWDRVGGGEVQALSLGYKVTVPKS